MRIIAPLFKLGLGGGVVYFIADQKLFSDSQKEAIGATKQIADSIPGFNTYLEKVPSVKSKQELIGYWNSGVKITCSTLAALPDNSKEAFSKGLDYVKQEFKQMMQQTLEK